MQKKTWQHILSMILVLTLLVSSVPMQVYAVIGDALAYTLQLDADDTAALEKVLLDTQYVVAEDESKRSECSKEFVLNNGLRLATIYSSPIHYEEDGKWKDIDNTLITTISDGSAFYTNTSGKWDVLFPQSLSGSNMICISKDGFTVQFGMAGELRSTGDLVVASVGQIEDENIASTLTVSSAQTAIAEVQQLDLSAAHAAAEYPETVLETLNSRLTYEGIYPNTNVVYDLKGNQLKESIILQQFDSTLWGYRYIFNTGDLVPVLNEDQQIDLCNPDTGDVVLTMPAPYMLDNNGEYSYDVEVSLVRDGSNYLLSYYLPMDWLAEETRAWPVILDPVIEHPGQFNYISDRTVFDNGTHAYDHGALYCGKTTLGAARIFLQYNSLPQLTSADIVVEASISLLCASSSTYEQVIEVHKVENTWTSQTITWDGQPNYAETIEDYAICTGPGRYTWNITDIVRDWYADTNTGMMFKTPESVETSQEVKCKQFFSSDFSLLAEELPMLSIKIRNANGLEDYWDYTSSSAGRAGVGYVNNYNGNLVWVCSDIDFGGNRMPVAISHVYNANDSMKNAFGMGYGWRTNYNQRVYQWELDDSYYVWEDSDGTLHYFYAAVDQNGVAVNNTYIDEDGLYLTLEVIGTGASATYQLSDKYGNISYFDTKGRLVKIENSQQTKSNISITYTTATSNLISKITDGVNRAYYFTYTNNLLSRISYKSTGSSEITYVAYSYTGDRLTSITDKSGTKATYTYGYRNLLLTAQDANEYQMAYTYNLIDTTAEIQPNRIKTITELDCSIDSDDPILGSQISIEYANNQTTFTDHNGNVMIMQFNNWGNTVAVMDGEGHGQFSTYKPVDNPTDIGNQLTLSSKLQNTVANMLADTSFEQSTLWSSFSTAVTQSISTTEACYGSKSLKITRATAGSDSGVYKSISVTAGESYTFSAYVKTSSTATAYLSIVDSSNNTKTSETLGKNSDWTRLEVSYTATTSGTIKIQLMTETAGTVYMDCVQLENTPTASRYNLVNNGDFRTTGYWTSSSNAGTNIQRVTKPTSSNNNAELDVPHLDNYAYQFTGNPQGELHLMQTIAVSGSQNDVFVLAGWAKGDSVPLTNENRAFCIRGVFVYSNGDRSDQFDFSFNPDVDSSTNWQYTAGVMVAPEDYTGIEVYLVYNYNANTVYFDGIQLYEEEFGYLYTYDDRGNITQVRDLQGGTTTYTYDSTTDDLTEIVYPDGTVTTYTYDAYHNVKTVTSDEGVVYTYTYDTYGNNVSVAVGSGNSVLTSTATYTSDGNRLSKTTDTAGNVTTYSYNADTNVLEWVQYPENNETQKTVYTYDAMYRMTGSSVTVSNGATQSVEYYYRNDLLTELETGSTRYQFMYTSFGLCSEIIVNQLTLVEYTYSTQDHRLTRLDYGNGDDVEYAYDDVGRVISQTYEDGDTITFAYDNNGALATVWDSATGRTTTYYYDTTNRLIRYLETDDNDYEHSVSYGYNEFNLLSSLKETINGTTRTTTYAYDDDNRISSVDSGNNMFTYGYDAANGRLTGATFKVAGSALYTRGYTYYGADTEMANRIQTVSYGALGYGYTYEYDDNGNITSVSDGTNTTRYTYDAAGQLLREDNQAAGKTWVWAYDNAGNIQSKKEYAYTTETLGTVWDTIPYTYSIAWGDLLTSCDGIAITYDDSGNRLSDGTWTYTWEHGRQLATMTSGNRTVQYTYDANGMRVSKIERKDVQTLAYRELTITTHNYVYLGGLLVQETINTKVTTTVYDTGITPFAAKPGTITTTTSTESLYFTYDANGIPASVSYTTDNGNTVEYYYVTNLQGDVVAIVNSTGTTVVQYTYDAWGKPLTTTGSMSGTLGVYNPLRYRGYVYDTETGLYYLQSRYYDPAVGRFINADSYISTGQGILGCNMFAYCRNNPVNHSDPSGMCGLCVAGKNSDQFMTDTFCGGGGGGAILIPVIPFADAIPVAIADTREKVIAYAETTRKKEYNNQSVYVLLNSKGEVRYVGRTNNPIVREYQHRNDPAHPWRRDYIMQVVATGLSLEDARLMEQMLISAYSLVYLENARREISKGNISGFYDHVNGLAELIGGVSPEYLIVMLGQ